MEFGQFMTDRLVELQRFATVLVGEAGRADALVVAAMQVARAQWEAVEAAGRPFAVVRAGIARGYLRDDDAEPVEVPGVEFAALSRTQRSVLVLLCYAGQSDAETAQALDLDAAEVRAAHRAGVEALGLGDTVERDTELADELFRGDRSAGDDALRAADLWLRDVLDEFGEQLSPDPAGLPDAIAAELSEAEGSPTAFAALFGSPGERADAIPRAVDDTAGDEPAADDAVPGRPAEPDPGLPTTSYDGRKPSIAAAVDALAAAADGRTWTRRLRWAALAASVIVAVGIAVLVGRRTDDSAADRPVPVPSATSSSATGAVSGSLSAPISRTLPGGRVLGEFFGSGSRTITTAIYTVAAGRELIVNAVCSGSGRAQLGPVMLSRCNGTPLAAAVAGRATRSIIVQAPASVTWRLVVVDSPPRDTNAALRYPTDPALRASAAAVRAAAQSGTGSDDVALSSGTAQSRAADVRVLLTCSGGPLSLSTSDGSLTGGRITACYDGWSYEFDVARTLLPGTLQLTATSSTSWRLVVLRG